jgi:hypothetical protein
MIGVIMGEEDIPEGKPDPVPHHLALVAFAAIEEQRLAFALHREPGHVAVDGRDGGASAEEGHAQHGRKLLRKDKSVNGKQ